MLCGMPRTTGKKTAKKAAPAKQVTAATKSRPRTVRLPVDDEAWVDEQSHPQGFSGVLVDAVRHYRAQRDETRKALLEAVS